MIAPTADEYAEWREHPTTVWMFAGVGRAADLAETQGKELAWQGVGEVKVERIKTRVQAYREIVDLSFEDAGAFHGEPV